MQSSVLKLEREEPDILIVKLSTFTLGDHRRHPGDGQPLPQSEYILRAAEARSGSGEWRADSGRVEPRISHGHAEDDGDGEQGDGYFAEPYHTNPPFQQLRHSHGEQKLDKEKRAIYGEERSWCGARAFNGQDKSRYQLQPDCQQSVIWFPERRGDSGLD
jgi:hypothetical protein